MNGVNLISVTVDDVSNSPSGVAYEVQLSAVLTVIADSEFDAVSWLMSALNPDEA